MTHTIERPATSSPNRIAEMRHLVERQPDGSFADRALCGYLWDRLHVRPQGELCEECREEAERKVREAIGGPA